ncbi:helix-turn-helix domain-containing protein [Paenibacillus caui]|uniref:helix-turn-helix domain-containing protein n=1 Tax=Paenibacillus caui TaxID=2873927 RepID=UPI001CA95D50|nr:helix-turn-helix transcriptional regulator [Paenibacillus caui]
MEPTTTIRAELENYLKQEGKTIHHFAEISGVNPGTISAIINGNRPIAMGQLDRITLGMGLEEGAFYDLYVDECFVHAAPNWRRIRPFLYRCAELDKLDCIGRIVWQMTDNLSYIPAIFETAEDFFRQGKTAAAEILYKVVAESEKYQHSERLALAQYRLFTITVGQDQQENLRAAVQFEPYVDRLTEEEQLDALKDLANMYASLRNWDKVNDLAKELGYRAAIQYDLVYDNKKFSEQPRETIYPLFLYILYAYLLQSAVCEERGEYVEALRFVSLYSDMSWVKETTEEAYQIMEQYGSLAEANTFLYKLMMGNVSVLTDYADYIALREAEILPALVKILEAANRFNIDVDDVLRRFEKQIASYDDINKVAGTYTQQMVADRYMNLMAELAAYHLHRQRYEEGIQCIINSLASAVASNSDFGIIKCVGLFEDFRQFATNQAQEAYKNLIKKGASLNEKKIGHVTVYG